MNWNLRAGMCVAFGTLWLICGYVGLRFPERTVPPTTMTAVVGQNHFERASVVYVASGVVIGCDKLLARSVGTVFVADSDSLTLAGSEPGNSIILFCRPAMNAEPFIRLKNVSVSEMAVRLEYGDDGTIRAMSWGFEIFGGLFSGVALIAMLASKRRRRQEMPANLKRIEGRHTAYRPLKFAFLMDI